MCVALEPRRPHTGPLSFCPLFCMWLGRRFVSACIHLLHRPSLTLILPLSLREPRSKGAIGDCLCLSDAGSGSRAAGQEPHFSTSSLLHQHRQRLALCPQVSMQQGERGAFSLDQGSCLAPILGKWPQSFGAHSLAPLHYWLMTSTQPQWLEPSVEMGHPPSCCSETANIMFASRGHEGRGWRDLLAQQGWPTWPSLLCGTLSAPLLPWPGEGTACGASFFWGTEHCSRCPFPGLCDSAGPSCNHEAGVLYHKMGSCLVGWAQTFVLMAGGHLPAPLQSSDLAGITQQADMR